MLFAFRHCVPDGPNLVFVNSSFFNIVVVSYPKEEINNKINNGRTCHICNEV